MAENAGQATSSARPIPSACGWTTSCGWSPSTTTSRAPDLLSQRRTATAGEAAADRHVSRQDAHPALLARDRPPLRRARTTHHRAAMRCARSTGSSPPDRALGRRDRGVEAARPRKLSLPQGQDEGAAPHRCRRYAPRKTPASENLPANPCLAPPGAAMSAARRPFHRVPDGGLRRRATRTPAHAPLARMTDEGICGASSLECRGGPTGGTSDPAAGRLGSEE